MDLNMKNYNEGEIIMGRKYSVYSGRIINEWFITSEQRISEKGSKEVKIKCIHCGKEKYITRYTMKKGAFTRCACQLDGEEEAILTRARKKSHPGVYVGRTINNWEIKEYNNINDRFVISCTKCGYTKEISSRSIIQGSITKPCFCNIHYLAKTEQQKNIMDMLVNKHMNFAEIARELGLTISAVLGHAKQAVYNGELERIQFGTDDNIINKK